MGILGKTIGTLVGAIAGPVGAAGGYYLGKKYDESPLGGGGGGGGDSDPYSGMPQYPAYIGMEPSQLQGAGLLNRAPMDAYTREAMRQGPSRGAMLAGMEQRRELGATRDQLRKQAMGEAAQARTALAMKGGIRGGAAERMGASIGGRALEAGQQARSGMARNLANIGMEDETNRLKMLGAAPGMQLGAAEYASKDIERQQLENTKRNAYNLGAYNAQMGAWGAGKQAQATLNSAKK